MRRCRGGEIKQEVTGGPGERWEVGGGGPSEMLFRGRTSRTPGVKGRLKEGACAFGLRSWVNPNAIYWARLKEGPFWREDWTPKPQDIFFNKVQIKREPIDDKRFNRHINHLFGSYDTQIATNKMILKVWDLLQNTSSGGGSGGEERYRWSRVDHVEARSWVHRGLLHHSLPFGHIFDNCPGTEGVHLMRRYSELGKAPHWVWGEGGSAKPVDRNRKGHCCPRLCAYPLGKRQIINKQTNTIVGMTISQVVEMFNH